MKERIKTIYRFRQDIEKKGPMNAPMGLWFRFFYTRYLKGEIAYQDAVTAIQKLRLYTGA